MGRNDIEGVGVICTADLPILVLVDDLTPGIYGHAIKIHQHGSYTHSMWVYRLSNGYPVCISQELELTERVLNEFLTGNYLLKFWHNPKWTNKQREKVTKVMWRDLKRPWYARLYDFLGIVGQALHLPFINIPWLHYCSENAGKYLQILEPSFKQRHPDPKDLNTWGNENEQMQVFGRFIPEGM